MSGKNRGDLDKIIEEKKKRSEENIRVLIHGRLDFNPNSILFSEITINNGGVRMAIDSLEKIFGIDIEKEINPAFFYEGEVGDKVRKSILMDLMINILEQKELKIRICGNCDNWEVDVCDASCSMGLCSKSHSHSDITHFSDPCIFESSKWISKKLPEEKKEEEKNCSSCSNYDNKEYCKNCDGRNLWSP